MSNEKKKRLPNLIIGVKTVRHIFFVFFLRTYLRVKDVDPFPRYRSKKMWYQSTPDVSAESSPNFRHSERDFLHVYK